MNLLSALKSFLVNFFKEPAFNPGDRVNLLDGSGVVQFDGFVLGQAKTGVWVEWPRRGVVLESPKTLSLIC